MPLSLAPGKCEAPPSTSVCDTAAKECKFKFEGSDNDIAQTFELSATAPNQPFSSRIVPKDPSVYIGIANSNNHEPELIKESDGAITPISQASTGGIQSLSRNLFKPFSAGKGSAMGHETFQQGQQELIKRRCVRVFITDWQVLDSPNGNVLSNVNNHVNEQDGNCVVFRTA